MYILDIYNFDDLYFIPLKLFQISVAEGVKFQNAWIFFGT